MMKQSAFDEQMKAVLKQEVEGMSVDAQVKSNIDRALLASAYKEEYKTRGWRMKKYGIVAVATLLLSATAVWATGQTTSLVSYSSHLDACKDYQKLGEQEVKLGYDVTVPEQFGNGYVFESMQVVPVEGYDDAGNQVEVYNDLMVDYNNGAKRISLSINKRDIPETFLPAATQEYKNEMLYYYENTYKFVPEGYELTGEDEANLEKPNYYLSVGSEEVEVSTAQTVSWDKDGVRYSLLGMDVAMSQDDLFEMAVEIMETKE